MAIFTPCNNCGNTSDEVMCRRTFDLSQRYGVSQCILSVVALWYTGAGSVQGLESLEKP